MASLQTIVKIPDPDFRISYTDNILTLGSCFSNTIGNRLKENKFKTLVNPFGVIYNPGSIHRSLDILVHKNSYLETDLNFIHDLWFSFDHYTGFSDPDKSACLLKINNSLTHAKAHLKNSSIVIITLGTAWAYRYLKTGEIVSNCHKIPAPEFQREFLSVKKITELLSRSIETLMHINPKIKVILTISPIRHWKDGAIENLRSKAALSLSIKELEGLYDNLYYFPVYEIFMDELRDYRFYASDMLHPSDSAIEYIWEKFYNTVFTHKTQLIIAEVSKLMKSFGHRPSNIHSNQFNQFVSAIENKCNAMTESYPFLDFSEDILNLKKAPTRTE